MAPIISIARTHNRPIRFLLVGIAVTMIDVGLTYLLTLLTGAKFLAVTAGFISGLLAGYLLHARISFSADLHPRSQIPKLLALATINYLLTIGCVFVATDMFGLTIMMGKFISLIVVAGSSYFISMHWIYYFDSAKSPRQSGNW
jgi:putative flippase GtrA